MTLLLLALACSGPGLTLTWDSEPGDHRPVPAVGDDLLVSSTSFPLSGNREVQAMDMGFADLWDHTDQGGIQPLTLDTADNTILGEDGAILALDPAGEEVWEVAVEGHSDQLFAVDGEVIYAAMAGDGGGVDSTVSAIAAGELQWSEDVEGIPHALAVGRDGVVFALTGEHLYAFDAEGDPVFDTPLDGAGYRMALGRDMVVVSHAVRVRAYNRGTGELEWVHRIESAWEPVVAPDGTVYLSSEEGLHVLDGRTGDLLWDDPTVYGPAALGQDGQLYTMAMLPEAGEDIWHFAVVSSVDGEITWHDFPWPNAGYVSDAPALDAGNAYYAAGDRLYAFEGAAVLGAGPWPRPGAGNANRRKELD